MIWLSPIITCDKAIILFPGLLQALSLVIVFSDVKREAEFSFYIY